MQKRLFKTTFILLIGTTVVKILGLIIKILYTRAIGPIGVSLFSLITPAYSLMVTLASLGMPMAISKLVAINKYRTKDIMSSSFYLILFSNVTMMLLFIIGSTFISSTLLHESKVKVLIIAASLAMPNMGLACIFKGYFYGKENPLPNMISNIIEQTIRLIFVIYFLPYFLSISTIHGITAFLLVTIITEASSIITFLLLLPKHPKIRISDIKYNKKIALNIMDTSIPLVSSKIIANIAYFFEPIILTNTLLKVGYPSDYFMTEYGIFNGYSLSLMLLPAYVITTLSQLLIAPITRAYHQKNYLKFKKILHLSVIFSFLFGLITSLIIFIYRYPLLNLIYHNDLGSSYILPLVIYIPLYYIEIPLGIFMQAMDKSKKAFKIELVSLIIKLLSIYLLTHLKIGLYGLIIGEALNIIYINKAYIKTIKKTIRIAFDHDTMYKKNT